MEPERASLDQYTGCLLGGAVGDALGAPVEFDSLEKIRATYGEQGIADFVEFPDHTGVFTDDTQMTLFTAEAMLRARHRAILKGIGGALPTIGYQSYLRWLYTQDHLYDSNRIEKDIQTLGEGWLIRQKELYQRRAPGNTCLNSLRSGRRGSIQDPLNDSKGCGTIMRVAPVGLMFFGEPELAFESACELSAITHGHPSGYLSAGFFAALISGLAGGENLEESIEKALRILVNFEYHSEVLQAVNDSLNLYEEINNSGLSPTADMIRQLGEGWVAEEALAISLFVSKLFTRDFEEGIRYAVNHSGDSDSTGSITGNILGLINGIAQVPGRWQNNLRHRGLLEEVARDLYIRVKGDHYHRDHGWWEKYPGS